MENAKTAPAACFVIDFDLLVCGLALGLGFEICFFSTDHFCLHAFFAPAAHFGFVSSCRI